jgi:hypothetical protein
MQTPNENQEYKVQFNKEAFWTTQPRHSTKSYGSPKDHLRISVWKGMEEQHLNKCESKKPFNQAMDMMFWKTAGVWMERDQ